MAETTVKEEETTAAAGSNKELLEQLLKPEVQAALTTLVDNLPKIAEMMTVLTKTYDFAQQVANDRVLIKDTVDGIREAVKPVAEKARLCAAAAIEASDRAEKDESTIGVFGMLKMLKDPELQKMLRFGQAYLDIVGERKKKQD